MNIENICHSFTLDYSDRDTFKMESMSKPWPTYIFQIHKIQSGDQKIK